jgi:hypothetical protein
MSNSINRIYHPFWKWEEVDHNMWGKAENRVEMLDWAIRFTGDHIKYGWYMLRVAKEWTYSCEHNLTNKTQNRKAWIGHAACALASNCPEDVVRSAWGHLTDEQQILANRQAEQVITWWESRYAKKTDRY